MEKVTCPYCGKEMKLIRWQTGNGNTYQYGCEFCGSKSPYCISKKDALWHAKHRFKDTKAEEV